MPSKCISWSLYSSLSETSLFTSFDISSSLLINEKYTFDKLKNILNKLSHDKNDASRLITRIMFPSFYFDKYEEIIINEEDDKSILLFKAITL